MRFKYIFLPEYCLSDQNFETFLWWIFLNRSFWKVYQNNFTRQDSGKPNLLLNEALKQNRYVERNWLKLQNQPVKSMNSYDRLIWNRLFGELRLTRQHRRLSATVLGTLCWVDTTTISEWIILNIQSGFKRPEPMNSRLSGLSQIKRR